MNRSNNQEAFPLLETKRLVLRELRPADAGAIFDMFSDEEVMRYRDVLPFTHLEEAEQFLELVRARYEQGEETHWAVALSEVYLLADSAPACPRPHLRLHGCRPASPDQNRSLHPARPRLQKLLLPGRPLTNIPAF